MSRKKTDYDKKVDVCLKHGDEEGARLLRMNELLGLPCPETVEVEGSE